MKIFVLIVGISALLLGCASTRKCSCENDVTEIRNYLDSTEGQPAVDRLFLLRGKLELMEAAK